MFNMKSRKLSIIAFLIGVPGAIMGIIEMKKFIFNQENAIERKIELIEKSVVKTPYKNFYVGSKNYICDVAEKKKRFNDLFELHQKLANNSNHIISLQISYQNCDGYHPNFTLNQKYKVKKRIDLAARFELLNHKTKSLKRISIHVPERIKNINEIEEVPYFNAIGYLDNPFNKYIAGKELIIWADSDSPYYKTFMDVDYMNILGLFHIKHLGWGERESILLIPVDPAIVDPQRYK